MSEIKVNKISPRSGTDVQVGDSGDTVSVAGNIVKTNALQASDGGNIINQCGTTITLGASGDSIALASGASQTGFGRTGTVDWQTGSIKTSTFTAANGEGYFADTSSGAFTMNLPAGTAGNIVSVVDYTNTFQTNSLTISPNGSQKIGGVASSQALSTEGQSVTFVYVDDTEGWKNVQDSTSNVVGNPEIQATGGTVTTSGNCKIHTFTGPGTFQVTSISTTPANNTVGYLVVAGGGAGGGGYGGGAGAGGFREGRTNSVTPYTDSPLGAAGHTITAQSYPITVGAGGASSGNNGSNSVFSSFTSAGGGYGRNGNATSCVGSGGSGGGGGGGGCGADGVGNTPPVSPAQGTPGGVGSGSGPQPEGSAAPNFGRGGGGGATDPGSNGSNVEGGQGGDGATTHITGSPVTYAGGGGGGVYNGPRPASAGGPGGGGGGAAGSSNSPGGPGNIGGAGTTNTGGGGGGGSYYNPDMTGTGGVGGSGIVVIRYKYQ
jgi:hypothetical protein